MTIDTIVETTFARASRRGLTTDERPCFGCGTLVRPGRGLAMRWHQCLCAPCALRNRAGLDHETDATPAPVGWHAPSEPSGPVLHGPERVTPSRVARPVVAPRAVYSPPVWSDREIDAARERDTGLPPAVPAAPVRKPAPVPARAQDAASTLAAYRARKLAAK